jgi:hypothetical protein
VAATVVAVAVIATPSAKAARAAESLARRSLETIYIVHVAILVDISLYVNRLEHSQPRHRPPWREPVTNHGAATLPRVIQGARPRQTSRSRALDL